MAFSEPVGVVFVKLVGGIFSELVGVVFGELARVVFFLLFLVPPVSPPPPVSFVADCVFLTDAVFFSSSLLGGVAVSGESVKLQNESVVPQVLEKLSKLFP